MWHVYILKCTDDSYYVGVAKDPDKRLNEHLKGRVNYTRARLPVHRVYLETYSKKSEAIRRERQIKSWKNKQQIEKLIQGGFV